MGNKNVAKNAILFVLILLQVIAAAVILWLIADKLYKYDINVREQEITEVTCALDPDGAESDSLCVTGFTAVGLTAAVLIGTSLVLCCTCDCCGSRLGTVIAFAAQTVLAIGWGVFASWVTDAVREIDGIDSDSRPAWNTDTVEDARLWVVILAWLETAAFAGQALISLLTGICCPEKEKQTY